MKLTRRGMFLSLVTVPAAAPLLAATGPKYFLNNYNIPVIDIGPKACPTGSLTAELSQDCRVLIGEATNSTGGAITFQMTDNAAGGPFDIIPLQSVPASGGSISWNFGTVGINCPGGLKWVAGGAGLTVRCTVRV